MIEDQQISGWDDLVRELRTLGPEWIFRGQEDARWKLATTLERSGSKALKNDEDATLYHFKRRARSYLASHEVPPESDTFAWLALMQHRGAPTRLLDFTRSPYVGLYFAFERATDGAFRALWAVNTMRCLVQAAQRMVAGDRAKFFNALGRFAFEPHTVVSDFCEQNDFVGVIPVEPWALDDRQAAQQTIFLAPGRVDISFDENLQALTPTDDMIRKFIISDTLRASALRDLRAMNVTAASLFPGLDGFARSMHFHLTVESEKMRALRRVAGQVPFDDPADGTDSGMPSA